MLSTYAKKNKELKLFKVNKLDMLGTYLQKKTKVLQLFKVDKVDMISR